VLCQPWDHTTDLITIVSGMPSSLAWLILALA